MTDFLRQFNKDGPQPKQNQLTSQNILEELMEQISAGWKDQGISAYVGTSEGFDDDCITRTLQLVTSNNENPYFYRLISIREIIGQQSPVYVSFYQNSPSEEQEVGVPEDLQKKLTQLMGEPRVRTIYTQLQEMYKTIEKWNNERNFDPLF